MSNRFHVWFYLGCYILLAVIGGLTNNWLILAYIYLVLTPLLVWFAFIAHLERGCPKKDQSDNEY